MSSLSKICLSAKGEKLIVTAKLAEASAEFGMSFGFRKGNRLKESEKARVSFLKYRNHIADS